MTPNPQNIGAALLPCPFCGKKALVELAKVRHCQLHGEPYQNTIIRCAARCASVEMGSLELAAREWNRRISPDAVGVPEAKPKGPSLPDVTQPGEGVDLEAIEARLKEAGEGPWKSDATWVMLSTLKAILADGPALIAEVRSLRSALEGLYDKGWTKEAIEAARATLRRESK